jgi:hypothetical protein
MRKICVLPLIVSTIIVFSMGFIGRYPSYGASNLNWTAIDKMSLTATGLNSVSCNSGLCAALGDNSAGLAEILYSTNDGANYQLSSYPADVASAYLVQCTGSSTCYVLASDISGASSILVTSDGGANYSETSFPIGVNLEDLYCLNSSSCIAVGSNSQVGIAYYLSSGSWVASSVAPGFSDLNQISCISASLCIAVGYQFASQVLGSQISINLGATFSTSGELIDISAVNSFWCLTNGCIVFGSTNIGSQDVEYSTNGVGWSESSGTSGLTISQLYCNSLNCFLIGQNQSTQMPAISYSSNLQTFSPANVNFSAPGTVTNISCDSANCYAFGNEVGNISSQFALSSQIAAFNFSSFGFPKYVVGFYPASMACETNSSGCALVGTDYIGTSLSQASGFYVNSTFSTWASGQIKLINPVNSVVSSTCPAANLCYYLGNSQAGPIVISTNNAGSSFSETNLNPGLISDADSISCTSATDCILGGSNNQTAVLLYTTDGSNWNPVTGLTGKGYVSSVSCGSFGCLAIVSGSVSLSAYVITNNFQSLSQTALPADAYSINASSCNSSTCVAVGNNYYLNAAAFVTLNSAASFSDAASQPPGISQTLNSVSCGSVNFCMSSGTNYSASGSTPILWATSSSASNFSEISPPISSGAIDSLYCYSSQSCFLGSGLENATNSAAIYETNNNGGSFMTTNLPVNLSEINQIECDPSSQCYSVGIGSGALYILSTAVPNPSVTGVDPATGNTSGGQEVTIRGGGFITVSAVNFGTVAAISYSVISPVEISAVVPANSAGRVDVTVTTASGTSTVNENDGYIYESAGGFTPVNPVRVCDTRVNATDPATYAGDTLGPGASLTIGIMNANGDNVPANATAVVVNVTVIHPTSYGYLVVWPNGVVMPDTSTINFLPGQDAIANMAEIPIGQNGEINIYNAFGNTDVAVDVFGYVAPSTGALFNPITPVRVADTRSYSGNTYQGAGNTLGPGATLTVNLSTVSSIGAGATAIVLNVTATDGTENGDYLTVYSGNSIPATSNVNFDAGKDVPNRVTIGITGGQVNVTNAFGSVNVIVDVTGWYGSSGYSYYPLGPYRISDTRVYPENFYQNEGQSLVPGSSFDTLIAGYVSIPAQAKAFNANVTVTNTTANGGYLVVAPLGTNPPTSDLNWSQGQSVANCVIDAVGSGGEIEVSSYNSATDVIVDVYGYFE